MNYRLFKNISFLIFLFAFINSKEFTCSEIKTKISDRYNNGQYDIAHNMAKTNKDKEGCSSSFYFQLGQIFKLFDDYKNTREMYNQALKISNTEGNVNQIEKMKL